MIDRPILFSGPMVRAVLDGWKTQTRRVVTPQPPQECGIHYMLGNESWLAPEDRKPLRHSWEAWHGPLFEKRPNGHLCGTHSVKSPYGVPGDRLWVREAWRVGKPNDTTRPRDILPPLIERGQGVTVLYEAGGWRSVGPKGREEPAYQDNKPMPEWAGKLRPSMFMPRAFSRITLEVTGVRVERLQDISEGDAIAEGVESPEIERYDRDRTICPRCGGTRLHDALGPNGGVMCDVDCRECDTHVKRYQHLWDSLNAERGYGWNTNPWVWVIEFRRIDPCNT